MKLEQLFETGERKGAAKAAYELGYKTGKAGKTPLNDKQIKDSFDADQIPAYKEGFNAGAEERRKEQDDTDRKAKAN